jgi:hypothetical protein
MSRSAPRLREAREGLTADDSDASTLIRADNCGIPTRGARTTNWRRHRASGGRGLDRRRCIGECGHRRLLRPSSSPERQLRLRTGQFGRLACAAADIQDEMGLQFLGNGEVGSEVISITVERVIEPSQARIAEARARRRSHRHPFREARRTAPVAFPAWLERPAKVLTDRTGRFPSRRRGVGVMTERQRHNDRAISRSGSVDIKAC